MNETIITPNNITFVIGIIGIMFGVYHYFKNPQIASEKKDALLAQQVQWQREGTEKRFAEIQANIKEAFELAQNHTHSVDVKVDALTKKVSDVEIGLAKLSTTIEERIPKNVVK